MDPFEFTESVALELSNSCSHAWLHKECPLHLEMAEPGLIANPITLPLKVIYPVLEDLDEHHYSGWLAFHQYNEPLQDPRLFMILKDVQTMALEAQVYIVTNGYNMTPTLAEELIFRGVKKIVISPTSEALRKRVDLLAVEFGEVIVQTTVEHILDDRLTIYDVPRPSSGVPCGAPLRNVVITRDGMVGLCCFDWKRHYTFGDLRERSLSGILLSPEVRDLHKELSLGNRATNLCRQCGRSR